MKPKIIVPIVALAGLGLLALIIWLFFTTGQPVAPAEGRTLSSVTPEGQSQVSGGDNWPTPAGLATFGSQLKLLAFSLPANQFTPGQPVEVSLYWETQTDTPAYNLFLHLVDTRNQLISQADMPLANRDCGTTGQFSAGTIETCGSLLLPDNLAAGEYQLLVGVYNPASGLRLATTGADNTMTLAPIQVGINEALAATPGPPCPVTVPNGSTPPGEQPSPDYYGNGQLWTVLWPAGKVIFEPGGPGTINADGSLGMKWGWWRGVEGPLTIEGRRLDAPAPPLGHTIPNGYGASGFQAAGLIFPTEGCWEVTGKVGAAELTFVTLVVKQDK